MRKMHSERYAAKEEKFGLHPVASERIGLWGRVIFDKLCVLVIKRKVVLGHIRD